MIIIIKDIQGILEAEENYMLFIDNNYIFVWGSNKYYNNFILKMSLMLFWGYRTLTLGIGLSDSKLLRTAV